MAWCWLLQAFLVSQALLTTTVCLKSTFLIPCTASASRAFLWVNVNNFSWSCRVQSLVPLALLDPAKACQQCLGFIKAKFHLLCPTAQTIEPSLLLASWSCCWEHGQKLNPASLGGHFRCCGNGNSPVIASAPSHHTICRIQKGVCLRDQLAK